MRFCVQEEVSFEAEIPQKRWFYNRFGAQNDTFRYTNAHVCVYNVLLPTTFDLKHYHNGTNLC